MIGLTGNITTMKFPEILQWVQYGSKSGVLFFSRQTVEKKVHFRDGKIIAAVSNDPREFLGQVLISLGMVTEDQLNDAFKRQAESQRLLGRILVEDFGILDEMMMEALHHKAEETLYDVFLWKEGTFQFTETIESVSRFELLEPPITGDSLLFEGARRADTWKKLQEHFPNPFCQIVKCDAIPDRGLARSNHVLPTLVGYLDSPKTIEHLILESHASPFLVYEALGLLLDAGVIEVKVHSEPRAAGESVDFNETAEAIVKEAEECFARGNETSTIAALLPLLELEGRLDEAKMLFGRAQSEFRRKWFHQIKMDSVLTTTELELSIDDDHEEFVYSRINGQWNVKSLMTILPMSEYEIMTLISRLLDKKLIEVSRAQ